MNICKLLEVVIAKRVSSKGNSAGIVIDTINSNEYSNNLFKYIDHESQYRVVLLGLIFLLIFLSMLFIAIVLIDTGTLLEFNTTNT